MIDTSNFRNGLSFILDNDIFQIIEFQHVKPGKGGAFVRTRLRNLRTGATIDKTFRAGEKMEQAILERKKMNYLYNQDQEYVFMDMDTFDQVTITAQEIGPQVKYLKDNTEVEVLSHDGKVLGVDLPMIMEFEVTETDPGLRGDTASGGSKPATVEGGAVVNVPLFVNIGDRIRIDTRTDSYLERAK
ncbi:MAG: elongation factor P [Actinomycetota bacterium]